MPYVCEKHYKVIEGRKLFIGKDVLDDKYEDGVVDYDVAAFSEQGQSVSGEAGVSSVTAEEKSEEAEQAHPAVKDTSILLYILKLPSFLKMYLNITKSRSITYAKICVNLGNMHSGVLVEQPSVPILFLILSKTNTV